MPYIASLRDNFGMRGEFVEGLKKHQTSFGIDLPGEKASHLADYYDLVQEHNPILHLVGPASAEEFAVRHILESLTLLEYLPEGAKFADVGTGAGLPSIPCLIARNDLKAVLIESKVRKAKFLEEAVTALGISERVRIVNRQFEEAEPGNVSAVTCRALDKFAENLPRLLKWSMGRDRFFFGGNNLRDALQKQKVSFAEKLMPLSEQRYLFIIKGKL